MNRLFGTDGIRGKANSYPVTPEIAFRLGRAISYYCKYELNLPRCKILIGKDTRVSGYMLENALVSGIVSIGAKALLVGPMPTPAMAFLVQSMRADAAVVISASHNLYEDNGLKLFSSHGLKLPDSVERKLEDMIQTDKIDAVRAIGGDIGKVYRIDDASGRYLVFVKSTFPQNLSLSGLKIVVDCANGASYKLAPTILQELGADITSIGVSPNGTNINQNCGALCPENTAKKVIAESADIGIALDGDGDRAVLVDETGSIVDGDAVMLILAELMKLENHLPNNIVVATIMSNLGLEIGLQKKGIELVRTSVGDRNVASKMREIGAALGGEQSGHIILSKFLPTGDGIITSLAILASMLKSGKKLSKLSEKFYKYPQNIDSVNVKEKLPLDKMKEFKYAIDSAKIELGDSGRVIFRYSGTENKARIMVEGRSRVLIDDISGRLVSTLQKEVICD